MENMFSPGELARFQNISKQTLLFYDKIGLFKPKYTDPSNGYRYYGAEQLDYLDTILILKKIGLPLSEIRDHMKTYTTKDSLAFLRKQLTVLDHKLSELTMIKNRLENRCEQVEKAVMSANTEPFVAMTKETCILYHYVRPPYSLKEISLATKQCYAQAFQDDIPIFFECGVSVPLEHLRAGQFIEATIAFVSTDEYDKVDNISRLPAGLTASIYHFGTYESIESSYTKLMDYCDENNLKIISDSYEFCVNDYITSHYESEFITRIMFYVKPLK